MREFEELDLLELMLAEDTARVFSGGAGFGAEASRPGGDEDGKFFFGNGFVAVEIVKLDFGSWREPEVGVLKFEKISGKLRQLARPRERSSIHKKRRQDFRVVVLAGVHGEEKICKGALEAGHPAFRNRKTWAREFRRGGPR